MSNEDQQEPAVQEVRTVNGRMYDANNIPGKLKAQLIADGEIEANAFVAPSNMPGKKLAELRKEHEDNLAEAIKAASKNKNSDIEFAVGMLVKYNKEVVEIQKLGKDETDKKRHNQLLLPKREGGTIWVPISKIEVLSDEELKALEEE